VNFQQRNLSVLNCANALAHQKKMMAKERLLNCLTKLKKVRALNKKLKIKTKKLKKLLKKEKRST